MNIRSFLAGTIAVVSALGAAIGFTACNKSDDGGQPSSDKPVECSHELQRVGHKDSTCSDEGYIAHYECSLCGKMFFDGAAKIELSEENIAIAKLNHSLEHYAATAKVPEYWRCIACGKYFTDATLTAETTYGALFADAYDPIKLNEGSGNSLNLFDSSSEISPLYDDFTLRCFIGWNNGDNKSFDEFPVTGKVQLNINLNREGAGTRVDWYNFGIGYSNAMGLFYKPVESGATVRAPSQFTRLFLEQGGIYVVVVRDGGTVSAYFEDADGNRQLFTSGANFGADEAVVRLAANQAEGTDSWTPFTAKTAICVGIAEPKCVFDKAYEREE